jgi:hypothetical protein
MKDFDTFSPPDAEELEDNAPPLLSRTGMGRSVSGNVFCLLFWHAYR